MLCGAGRSNPGTPFPPSPHSKHMKITVPLPILGPWAGLGVDLPLRTPYSRQLCPPECLWALKP